MNTPEYEQWIKSQQEIALKKSANKSLHSKKFVGDRGYLHFDGRVTLKRIKGSDNSDPAFRLVASREAIASHAFFPFLREDQRFRKYRDKTPTTSEGGKRRHDQQYSSIKNRPIMYASHLDACVYSLYSNILGAQYEAMVKREDLGDTVLAYRPIPLPGTDRNKSNIDFAKELYEKIKDFNGDAGLLLLDVSGFFDNLDHKLLYEKWCRVIDHEELPDDHRAIYKNITNFRYIFTQDAYSALELDREALKRMRKNPKAVLCSPKDFNEKIKKQKLIHKNRAGRGIPQGSPISGLLANMYMIEFDIKVKKLVEASGGYYARYSDDILILVEPAKLTAMYQSVKKLILEEKLKISTKKTEGFVYKKELGTFLNVIRELEPQDTLNLKKYPQYLGFVFTEDTLFIRSNTLARRFRGGRAFLLKEERWRYFSLASKKIDSEVIPRQVEGIRKKIRPVVHKAQLERTKRNRERNGIANS